MEVKTCQTGIWDLAVDGELIRNEDFLKKWKYEDEKKIAMWPIAAIIILFWSVLGTVLYFIM